MITESRKREPSAKICKQIDKRRQASCRVRPLAVGTITKKDRRKPVWRSSGYRCIQILCDAGRYPLGIAESRKREPSAKICKQIDERRQASCRVRPLAVGIITKKDRRKPVRRSSGYRCIQILCDAGRYPSGIAESRKREPSAKICKQIDERRQASCRVRPLAVGIITKKDRRKPVFFCYGAAGRGRTDTVSLPRDFESRASANSTTAAFFVRCRFLSTFFA